ncbi:ATP-binding protein [Streptomyces sp. NPDC060194]|uniref:ATP-binding protein n=1 Tax=Streptomyces sp. NPDC060194 TaxID=3347069 RepID=UPI00365DF630
MTATVPAAPSSWRIELPHTAAAVPIARALVRTALADISAASQAPAVRDPDTGDTAELLTAELVANAVEHTPGDAPIELVIELLPNGWQFEVHDDDPQPPADLAGPVPEPDPFALAEDGRGLLLIRTLSTACGHRPTAQGKAVWFTL